MCAFTKICSATSITARLFKYLITSELHNRNDVVDGFCSSLSKVAP
ncbi:MAG: hypothetical protein Harvfovirus16_3 [Harvfovirus sp.]|uniref:Uncharacterized protein n=1 Tax=Harvfovirus sp. TaxID=2487768 RepID=A0A3G5A5K5_9VIRU|nr:MAG: hypothetical protein Harvfovirus16_3 [Harvfovirus sp.]